MLDHTKLWLGQNSCRSSIDDHDEKEERELSWAWVQKTIIIVLGDHIKLRFKLRQIKSGVPWHCNSNTLNNAVSFRDRG